MLDRCRQCLSPHPDGELLEETTLGGLGVTGFAQPDAPERHGWSSHGRRPRLDSFCETSGLRQHLVDLVSRQRIEPVALVNH